MPNRLNVLVADDHPTHRALLRTLFECFGCSVTTVNDGAEALAAGPDFDLICFDRHMPVMDGPTAAKAMRSRAFMVACTSDPKGDLSDFHLVLAKPIGCEDVARAVASARCWRLCRAALDLQAPEASIIAHWVADTLRRSPALAQEVRRMIAAAARSSRQVPHLLRPAI